jgi:hypothetical protein
MLSISKRTLPNRRRAAFDVTGAAGLEFTNLSTRIAGTRVIHQRTDTSRNGRTLCGHAAVVNQQSLCIAGRLGGEGEPGAPQPEVSVYPPTTYGKKQPKYFIKMPKSLSKLYKQVVLAFNSGSMLLCTIGLRALIEGICVDKGITSRKLEHKIDGLSQFFPNKTLIDSLHGFRFTGNDAAHDLAAMYPSEASEAIEVMEDLLDFLYDFDYKASQIKNAARRAKIREQESKSKGSSVQ